MPVLVVAGGLIAWLLTGRALRPVQGITARVGAISSGNLHERVPEPGTGDEIAELAATMNAMLDRLEVDDRRLRQFVSDASHELRSPFLIRMNCVASGTTRLREASHPNLWGIACSVHQLHLG